MCRSTECATFLQHNSRCAELKSWNGKSHIHSNGCAGTIKRAGSDTVRHKHKAIKFSRWFIEALPQIDRTTMTNEEGIALNVSEWVVGRWLTLQHHHVVARHCPADAKESFTIVNGIIPRPNTAYGQRANHRDCGRSAIDRVVGNAESCTIFWKATPIVAPNDVWSWKAGCAAL